ncbi:hypothetical protein ABL57_04450 [Kocuria sp. SM24M-10]|nr:hypothetical protein ABL57_04450 [Kocuria sp. SM24M-10]
MLRSEHRKPSQKGSRDDGRRSCRCRHDQRQRCRKFPEITGKCRSQQCSDPCGEIHVSQSLDRRGRHADGVRLAAGPEQGSSRALDQLGYYENCQCI